MITPPKDRMRKTRERTLSLSVTLSHHFVSGP